MINEPKPEQLKGIPKLYETDDIPPSEVKVYLHFWMGLSDWYVTEFDGNDTFFGFTKLAGMEDCAEWGYFTLQELREYSGTIPVNVDGNLVGVPVEVETDWYWQVCSAKDVSDIRHYGL